MKFKHILLVSLIMIIGVGQLLAQTAQTPYNIPPGTEKITLASIFRDSNAQGIFGYLILLTFIIGIVYAIIRYIQLYHKEKVNAPNLYKSLKGYLQNNQLEEALRITEKLKDTTLGYIFWNGINTYKEVPKDASKEEISTQVQNAFDEAALQKVYKLDAGLFWFDILAQVCTYLGLLGTIWGLLYAFAAISNPTVLDTQKNLMLSAGIKTAIGTTALGLMAAIPLTLIKGALLGRAQKIINDIDEYSVKFINFITNVAKG
ncbi:MAG: MotA/TolQ/ExbB proton channel family protein [Candidatus Cloacimonadaceae bacterium]|jgi:biopolymer transport protein ExbB|nr:MotA/TolQ/ExbB proton channel family protein [Candidatus Cloacimonadota bacterium]MDD5625502.1 MotA/TolQ/ExbB proton channel family protein [Candidatus Cloacimonadota bacterium]MDY0112246.1 MotA/TolQ/ExbB proton channel family protein [Candidatus Syntrophosphaera sp.]